MPPKVRFSEEDVLQAAFELVREEGLPALSARNIAVHLGASTTPVYSAFASMEKLRWAVMERVVTLVHEYTQRSYTENRFLNMGTGIAVFAREEPQFYRALYLETSEFKPLVTHFQDVLAEDMVEDDRFAALTFSERLTLLLRMAMITYGLATMICVGLCEESSDEEIIEWLLRVGGAVIPDEVQRILRARKPRVDRPRVM